MSSGADLPRALRAATREEVALYGRMRLRMLGLDGVTVGERRGDNVICTTGFTVLAASLVWSGIQDQAGNTGQTTATYLTPLYGAVGSSGTAPVKSDTQLGAELGRQTVGAGAGTPASSTIAALTTWLFYFPSPSVTWTVAEAGVFANASSTANSGSMIDHWAFSPTLTVSTVNTLILEVSIGMGP